jgi:hypothetical protein
MQFGSIDVNNHCLLSGFWAMFGEQALSTFGFDRVTCYSLLDDSVKRFIAVAEYLFCYNHSVHETDLNEKTGAQHLLKNWYFSI